MMRILTRRVRPILREIIESRFYEAKEWLLDAVVTHDISQDISSHGPSPRIGSGGTLYGFIGFDASEQPDPIEDLVNFLDSSIHFVPQTKRRGALFSSSIIYPSKNSFNDPMFQLDWINRGWPLMIEEGISGLPYYLNKGTEAGRSTEGIQTKGEIGESDWKGVPYLTPLFDEFRKRLLIR
jgi:hypothetical protein